MKTSSKKWAPLFPSAGYLRHLDATLPCLVARVRILPDNARRLPQSLDRHHLQIQDVALCPACHWIRERDLIPLILIRIVIAETLSIWALALFPRSAFILDLTLHLLALLLELE